MFVCISIDRKEDYKKWKSYVTKNKMEGIQLYADKSWDSEFIKKYNIHREGILEYIVLDTLGNIVSVDAPAPYKEKRIESLFKGLKL